MTQEAILIKTRNENMNYYDNKKVRGIYEKLPSRSNKALNRRS